MSILHVMYPVTSVSISVGIGIDSIAMFLFVEQKTLVAIAIFKEYRRHRGRYNIKIIGVKNDLIISSVSSRQHAFGYKIAVVGFFEPEGDRLIR